MADDDPYELMDDGEPTGIVELPPEWIRDDAVYFNMLRFSALRPYTPPSAVEEIFTAEFDGAWEEGGLFLLTMHPHIIGHRSRMPLLERLIAHIKAKGQVLVRDACAGRALLPGGGEGRLGLAGSWRLLRSWRRSPAARARVVRGSVVRRSAGSVRAGLRRGMTTARPIPNRSRTAPWQAGWEASWTWCCLVRSMRPVCASEQGMAGAGAIACARA